MIIQTNPSRKILAIVGRAGSGKTTLARLLEARHNYAVMDFAQPLKDMIWSLLLNQGMPPEEINDRLNGHRKEEFCPELSGRTARYAMQTLGYEWRELIDTNLWVNVWERRVIKSPKIVVADLRFPHELERVRKLNGRVISLVRGEDLSFGSLHESERHFAAIMAQSDLVIVNDMTPLDMLRQVENFFGDWL